MAHPPYMQADIEALKEKHGRISRSTITVDRPDGDPVVVEFIWRHPKHSDWERVQPSLNKGERQEANQLLMRDLIVWPNRAEVMKALADSPLAVPAWIDEVKLLDFFGQRTKVTTEEL